MADFKKGDHVLVTNYATPRPATILKRCPRNPNKWVVIFEGSGFVKSVKEGDLKKA